MGYDIEGVGRSVEHLAHKVSSLTDAAVARLEAFAINHYTPTRTASSGGTGA